MVSVEAARRAEEPKNTGSSLGIKVDFVFSCRNIFNVSMAITTTKKINIYK